MRIALDAHTLGSRVGGNETYIRQLIEGLKAIDKKNDYCVYHTSANPEEHIFKNNPNFRFQKISPKNPLIRIPFSAPRRLAADKIDLFLLQYVAPPVCPVPYILVIHDISYEHYPQYFKPLERLRLKLTTPFSAKRAAHIVTCSEYSKKDLMRFYGIPEEKISVIYYGKSGIFRQVNDADSLRAVKNKYSLPEKFILYVGNIQPRKNLPRLLEAFRNLKKEKNLAHKLVIVGNKAWLYSDVFEFIRKEGLETEVVFTGYVPEEDLPLLYNAADAAVYPSLFEGFGFPVLEAMACGTPVITSDSSSLPEVAGDAALLINPLSVSEIARAIGKVLGSDRLRAEMREKGLKQAALFSWEKTARETLELFERIYQRTKVS